ncbi:MAG TPA: EscU/YscU/HrcU family type III secretion system export apparatus switch protein [Defluviitaleaceae bacterium]|nr:flagellar biogenesis protein [Candidatus Epulonipiscium sp.]HOQ15950.1 EscU/YscU/HrcU family type III secretion system export apparatus switch protein [Defluviitaleaceae bacterium]HPT76226.1 EscU/YscU/HrcU family type III secretion system export apparatus switch protein [Defluviitaleaceae bacterium]HQD51070.1 EscU/YscU/HrcU family type III secretion system export apparatus switch protein [Defluviitaleaceae bacterium]
MENNKRIKKAAALHYEKGSTAPKVIAKGKGVIAEKIIEKGLEEEIPVYEDEKLANVLTELEIGELIPVELYEIVAEILVFVGDIDRLQEKIKNG